jgi:hypothetical protein
VSLQWLNGVFIPRNQLKESSVALASGVADQHVVEVNGVVQSTHVHLIDAEKAALSLSCYYPEASVRIRHIGFSRHESFGTLAA